MKNGTYDQVTYLKTKVLVYTKVYYLPLPFSGGKS